MRAMEGRGRDSMNETAGETHGGGCTVAQKFDKKTHQGHSEGKEGRKSCREERRERESKESKSVMVGPEPGSWRRKMEQPVAVLRGRRPGAQIGAVPVGGCCSRHSAASPRPHPWSPGRRSSWVGGDREWGKAVGAMILPA